MDKIPFGVYDFFAYLSSGTVLLATLDYVCKTGLLSRQQVTPILGVVLIIAAYVSGQIIAHFSSFILERLLVGKLLKRPTTLLLDPEAANGFFRFLFPQYHRALPVATRLRIKAQAHARTFNLGGENLFLHAYAIVTRNEKSQARLDEFRNQYGFARNMCFAFLSASLLLFIARFHDPTIDWKFVLVAFGAGLALLYRYLKFFRQYSYELFMRYAELPTEQANTDQGED